jgi:hypothetical protein
MAKERVYEAPGVFDIASWTTVYAAGECASKTFGGYALKVHLDDQTAACCTSGGNICTAGDGGDDAPVLPTAANRAASTTAVTTEITFAGMSAAEFTTHKDAIVGVIASGLNVHTSMLTVNVTTAAATTAAPAATATTAAAAAAATTAAAAAAAATTAAPATTAAAAAAVTTAAAGTRRLAAGDTVILEVKVFVTPGNADAMVTKFAEANLDAGIDSATGLTGVTATVAAATIKLAAAPPAAPTTTTTTPLGTACNEAAWPDLDHGLICGECKVLVNHFSSKYFSCDGACFC